MKVSELGNCHVIYQYSCQSQFPELGEVQTWICCPLLSVPTLFISDVLLFFRHKGDKMPNLDVFVPLGSLPTASSPFTLVNINISSSAEASTEFSAAAELDGKDPAEQVQFGLSSLSCLLE
ncbi:hypothetical protein L208DRAFT_47575 [Tricholoma matsutake]|nr:hypothetical protein L208DRAFT_47575 [Tricholoma matsutake 945]